MKRTLLKTIALGSLLTCSAAVMADSSDYKLMVIKTATAPLPLEESFNSCALTLNLKITLKLKKFVLKPLHY